MNQEKTVEEPLLSQAKMNEYKEREFREYLVNQDVTLAIVKCMGILCIDSSTGLA